MVATREVAAAPLRVVVRDRAPLLPKIAFVLIGVASLLGTALSNRGLGVPLSLLGPRWLSLWAAAATVGFVGWRLAYLRIPRDDAAPAFHDDLVRRAAQVGRALGLLSLATVPVVLAVDHLAGRGVRAVIVVAGLGLVVTLVRGMSTRRDAAAAGVAALAVVLGWAVGDAGAGTGGLLRGLHLLAFGMWIGGAVWNLTVAIPVGRRHPTIPAVVSGAEQLQRFRRVARVALPTVVVTGIAMALPYLGTATDLLETVPGRFIAGKAALIVALVVIFITCPMFRQCSPVSGVCDLDELEGERSAPRRIVGAGTVKGR